MDYCLKVGSIIVNPHKSIKSIKNNLKKTEIVSNLGDFGYICSSGV
jgi:hypothetical protein